MGIELAEATVKVTADVSKVGSEAESSMRGQGGIFGRIGEITGGILGANLVTAGIEGIKRLIDSGIDEAKNATLIQAQFAQGIKSTGNAAGLSVVDMTALEKSVAGYSGQSVVSIGKTEQVLQTFTNLKNVGPNKIFDEATMAAANMAAKMGGDASSSAIQLGIALNDPTAGIAKLHRVGVAFTTAQTDQIKAMQKSGDLMGAQKIIIAELGVEFGGAAKAAGETWPGALNRIKVAFGEISGTIVGSVEPIILPVLNAIANGMVKLEGPVEHGAEIVKEAFKLIREGFMSGTNAVEDGTSKWAGFGATVSGIFGKVTEVVHSFWAIAKPIVGQLASAWGAIIPAIAPLIPQVLSLASSFSPLGLILKMIGPILPTIAHLFVSLAATLGGALTMILPIITKLIGQLVTMLAGDLKAILPAIVSLITVLASVFVQLLPSIMSVASVVGDVLLKVFKELAPVIPVVVGVVLLLIKALMPLVPPILKVVEAFLPLVAVLGGLIADILPPVITLLMAIIKPILAIIPPIIAFLVPALNVLADVVSVVVKNISDYWNWVYAAVFKPVIDLIIGVFGLFSAGVKREIAVVSAIFTWLWSSVIKPVGDWIGGAITTIGDTVGRVFGGIGAVIMGGFSGVVSFVKGIFNTIIGLVNGIIDGINGATSLAGAVGVHVGAIPHIAKLATGTNNSPDTFIAGENGPELITGAQGSTVRPYQATKDILAGLGGKGGKGDVHIHGDIILDAKNVQEFSDVVDMLKALPQVARSGNGYNGKAA